MQVLLDMLEPLILKYSKKLYLLEVDDSKQELRLSIIEAVHKISRCETDGECLKFLKNAVLYKYTYLCKKSIIQKDKETSYVTHFSTSNPPSAYEDIDSLCDLIIQKHSLPPKQQLIFEYLISGYSDSEISAKMGLSRQYVNRIKKHFI